jgi:hypothetical protein
MNKITFICNEQRKSKDEFFVFEPDVRLFTSYAFMNAAGYGHDWNPMTIKMKFGSIMKN